MQRRAFLASALALAAPVSSASVVEAKPSEAQYILCGDSHAFMLAPIFRLAAKAYGVKVDVVAHGGSSVRQWLVKKWMQKLLREHPRARVIMISLGTNCTRVERPKLKDDIDKLLAIVNDWDYEQSNDRTYGPAPCWLLPPPFGADSSYLEKAVAATEVFAFGPGPLPLLPPPFGADSSYLEKAVAATEVFAFGPGPLPLLPDKIHPTPDGLATWMAKIAEVMWE